jgi:hypothetical protein
LVLAVQAVYKLNNGQKVSKKEILDAFAKGNAVLVYYQDARMSRPAIGLMLDGVRTDDTRPFEHYSGVVTADLGQWSERPTSAQQCLDIAARNSK